MRMCLLLLLLTYLLTRPGLPLPLSAEGDSWGAAVRCALLAEQGNPSAALNLAWLLHRRGAAHSGPPNHHVLALPLWLRAAGRNETEGMLMAAHSYMRGTELGLEGGAPFQGWEVA